MKDLIPLYSLSGVGVTLQQTIKNDVRFKVNHDLIYSSQDKAGWKCAHSKRASYRTSYRFDEIDKTVHIRIIGNNVLFDLQEFTANYAMHPVTYLFAYAEACAFLVDNHFIIPPDARPSDPDHRLIFKSAYTGRIYRDSREWAVMELLDHGNVTTICTFKIPSNNPVARKRGFDSGGYAIEAMKEDGYQKLKVMVRSKGRAMLDAMEGINNGDYFRNLSRNSDGKFLLLGDKVRRFFQHHCKIAGQDLMDLIPKRWRMYDTFSECFRFMFPLTKIDVAIPSREKEDNNYGSAL